MKIANYCSSNICLKFSYSEYNIFQPLVFDYLYFFDGKIIFNYIW